MRRKPVPRSRGGIYLTLALVLSSPARADVLVDNVDGLTLTAEGKVQRFNGLLVDDKGRIQQIFQRADKRPARVDYRLDGKGRVLMPGLIDSRVELMQLGLARITPDVRSTPAKPRPEDRDLALMEAQRLLLERGITAVTDMGTSIEDWQAYRRAGDLGALSIRIMAYAANTDAMSLIGGPGPTPWLYDDRLRLNGVRLTLDGTLAAHTAALKAPYADAPKASGQLRVTEIQLKNLMSRAAIDRFQPAVEATGDRANAMLLDAIAELAETYKGDRRWRIELAQVVDPADVPRFGKNDVAVSIQPQQWAASRAVDQARLGALRPGGTFAWKSLSAAGAKLAFGSGASAELPEPFAAMATALTRSSEDGQPQEVLTREEALAAFTTGPAWAGFAEGRMGRIALGQRADFLLVDRDPLTAAPAELRDTRVLQTWVGGKIVYQAKEMTADKPAPSAMPPVPQTQPQQPSPSLPGPR